MGRRLLQEYRKTAELVGCQPWYLLKARKYLEKLCLDNETGHVPQGPPLAHYQMKDIAPGIQMVSGVQVQPRRVFVETPGPAEQRRHAKRVAAAAQSLDTSEAEEPPPVAGPLPKSADSAAPAADTGGTPFKRAKKTKRMPAAALASPEGVEVRNHHGWRKSGNAAGKHWKDIIWTALDGTPKRAEAAGFIDEA